MIALAIIAAALLLLALLPVGMCLQYDGTTRLAAQIGFLRVQLIPSRPKKRKQKQQKKKPAKPQSAPQPKKQRSMRDYRGLLTQIQPFFGLARDFIGSFRRHLKIRKLKLHIRYGAENPADAAIRYGQAWAAIGCVMPILQSAFRICRQDVQAICDDHQKGFSAEAELYVTLYLYELLGMGTKYGIRAGKLALPLLKNFRKAVQKT